MKKKDFFKKIDNNSLIKSTRVIFLFFIFLFFVDSAISATYIVTTTANSGPGSLRNAIAQANSTTADDTIVFNITSGCSGGVCTITLTSGGLVINSTFTAGSLTITNAGGSQRIEISGNNSDIVFFVHTGANLTIDSITIRNGSAGGGNGGGVKNNGGTVTIINSTITNNSASGGNGGGIYNSSAGTVNITNSTITNNSAGFGGGIYNGIGTVNITNSTITNNSVSNQGGGIANDGTVNITNSTITNNSASFGGGIDNLVSGTVNITNSTITNNSSSGPGGGIDNIGTVNITNSTITNNSASNYGGGIDNGIGTVTIINSTITNNSAGLDGGGINNGSTVTIINSTITNNSASGGNGGGISTTGTVNITNSTITNNSARLGGGIANGGTVNITNSTITNNSASNFGGGIYNYGTVNARNTIIANNSAPNGPDFDGILNSQGYNLIKDTSGTTITGVTTGNITGQDPLLTPLGYYGGSTWTRALFFESPALNAGSNCVRTAGACAGGQPSVAIIRDQRGASRQGFSRLVGAGPVDIGAYEFNPLYFAVLPDGTQNSSYSFVISQYSSSEGTFSFTMTGLPNGLSLQTQTSGSIVTVVITGTPTQSGFFQPQLSITSGSQTVTVSYAIKIGV